MLYDLFFTTERVIAVIIQHPADGPRQFPSLWKSMFLGSFWSAGREQIKKERAAKEKRRNLQSMTPDELASTHPRNFNVRYSDIASVEIKRRFLQWQLRFHVSGKSNMERVVSFNLSKKQVPEAQRLLELASLDIK